MGRKHLIIGCGSAAISALEKIRSITLEDEIKVVTREDYLPYSPTALPYLLSRRISENALWMRPESYFSDLQATFARGKELARVLPENKEVIYADGEREAYDTLLIATGSQPVTPPIKGLDQAGSLCFRTLDDYKLLVQRTARAKSVTILGAGLVGMEVAIGLMERGMDVNVVARGRVLRAYFDVEAEAMIREIFRQHGTHLFTGNDIAEVRQAGAKVEIDLAGGDTLQTDVVVAAMGVQPRTGFLEGSGVKISTGILADRDMQTNVADIYAAGDVAESADFFSGTPGMSPIIPSAVAQGRAAGASMARQPEPFAGWIGMNVFHFLDNTAFSVGQASPTGEGYKVASFSNQKAFRYGKLVLRDGKLIGATFINSSADPGLFADVVRHRLDVSGCQEALLERPQQTARQLMMERENRGFGSRVGE